MTKNPSVQAENIGARILNTGIALHKLASLGATPARMAITSAAMAKQPPNTQPSTPMAIQPP